MFSIYTNAYNLFRLRLNWREVLTNWADFLDLEGEIIIAVNKSDDDTVKALNEFIPQLKAQNGYSKVKYVIVECGFEPTEPNFISKLQNEALKKAKSDLCIGLSLNDYFPLYTKDTWVLYAINNLLHKNKDAARLPVMHLAKNPDNYYKIDYSIILHKNNPEFVLNDALELTAQFGQVIESEMHIMSTLPRFMQIHAFQDGQVPFIFNIDYINFENKFTRASFWSEKAKKDIDFYAQNIENYSQLETFTHNLRHWNQK